MKAELEKINAAMNLTKVVGECFSPLDPVRVELDVALACLGRARRLLRERPVESANTVEADL